MRRVFTEPYKRVGVRPEPARGDIFCLRERVEAKAVTVQQGYYRF